MRWIAGPILAGTMAAGQAWATDVADDCAQSVNWTIKFEGCTALIEHDGLAGPALAEAYAARCRASNALLHPDEAMADCNTALRLDPGLASALTYRGDAYGLLLERERAIEDYDAAIALDPGSAEAFVRRGETHARIGAYERAIADFEQALHLAPDSDAARRGRAVAQNELARALYLEGHAAEGLPVVEEALQVLPLRPTIIDTRAHIFAALGRTDDALTEFERAMTSGGTNVVYAYRLALTRHGLDPGPADGRYGAVMRRALAACLDAGCRLVD